MEIKIQIEQEFNARFLKVNAEIRGWEDSIVNGVSDTEEGDTIPCKEGDSWKPVIDIDEGCIINWEQGKTASIHYKVCDEGSYEITEEDGSVIAGIYNDYVPRIMCPKENGYGDYIIMDVDENGFIDKWDKSLISVFSNSDEY